MDAKLKIDDLKARYMAANGCRTRRFWFNSSGNGQGYRRCCGYSFGTNRRNERASSRNYGEKPDKGRFLIKYLDNTQKGIIIVMPHNEQMVWK